MSAVSVTLAVGFLSGASGAAMQGVELTGLVFDSAPEMTLTPQQQAAFSAFENFCNNNDQEDLEALYTQVEVQVASKLAEVGMGAATDFFPSSAEIDEMLDAVKEACDREESDSFGFTTLIYSECRMTMDGMTGQLDLKIPAGSDGHMIAFDGTEGVKVNLTQRVQEVSGVVGQGWSSDVQWQAGPGQTVERAGYPATSAQFEYSVGMGPGYGSGLAASQQAAEGQLGTEDYLQQMQGAGLDESQGLQMLSGMVSNKVTGWGYFSTAVPGIDIVQSFYRNFAESVSPSGDLGSFFGGMIMSSVALLEKGIPLEMHTTLETKLMGKTMVSGESASGIYTVKLVDLPSDWCSRSFIDESLLTDIDAQMQQALSGSSGGGAGGASGTAPGLSAEQAAQANQGMEALSQAMQQMTPEQKQALQGMGLGSMMPETGADSGGQPAAGSAGVAPSRSGPSSADLTTDDVTQSVQNHLQALGYDPGVTNGEMSMETTIAISTFQAEKGMEVTGEVSPQLLGVLSAEVDSRR
jgi:hypothetical protein